MKEKAVILLVKMTIWILSRLPFRILQYLGRIASRYKGNKIHDTIKENINRCFIDKPRKYRDRLIKKSYEQFMITCMEMISICGRTPQYLLKQIKEVENFEEYNNVINSGKPVIMLGSHIGCWEIGAMYIANSIKTSMLYTPIKNKYVDIILHNARSRLNNEMAPASMKGIKKMLASLKKNECTALLTDQVPSGVNASYVYTKFFNHSVKTMVLPDKLYEKSNATVLYVNCLRRKNGGLKICVKNITQDIIKSKQENPIIHISSNILEQTIKENPEQYQWSYKRFKGAKLTSIKES